MKIESLYPICANYMEAFLPKMYKEPITDNFGAAFIYDEVVAFEHGGRQLTYYFLKGKYQARGLDDLAEE